MLTETNYKVRNISNRKIFCTEGPYIERPTPSSTKIFESPRRHFKPDYDTAFL